MAAYTRIASPSRGIASVVCSKLFPVARAYSRTALRLSSSSALPEVAAADKASTIRLSKLIAQHGTNQTMSRREAERYIRNGDVTVAGQVITSPHFQLDWEDASAVKVQGKHLQVDRQPLKTRVWLVHKLPGEVVSERDPQGRPSLIERLMRTGVGNKGHLKPIGRLDMSTEGLILMTTDGSYARELELPINKVHRTYRVRVHGKLTPHKLKGIRSGMTIKNTRYGGMKVQLEDTKRKGASSTNTWLRITCTEGKNRQIRNVLSHLGLNVTRLIRISYGDYQLQTIPPGMALEVPVKALTEQRHKGTLVNKKAPTKKRQKEAEPLASPVQWVRHV